MKNILIFVFITMTIAVSGCATRGINISKNGTVTIEREASKKVFIPWADVYQDGNNLTIAGVVEQRYHSADSFKAYIDVTIWDDNGQPLKEARTVDIYVPRKSSGKGINWTDFNLTVPMVVPKGVIIKLTVHGA
jgi:hypothetical protein